MILLGDIHYGLREPTWFARDIHYGIRKPTWFVREGFSLETETLFMMIDYYIVDQLRLLLTVRLLIIV